MSRQIYDSLRLELATMPVGATSRLVCPWCRAEHENSLCLTRKADGGLYICPRIVCKKSGFIPLIVDSGHSRSVPKEPVKEFIDATSYPSAEIYSWLELKYQLDLPTIQHDGWLMSDTNRLVFPLKDVAGNDMGVQAKLISHKPKIPKVLTYLKPGKLPIHFPYLSRRAGITNLTVVEDVISATKCSLITPTCAILGTSPKQEVWVYLATITDSLTLLLDPDALAVAIKLKRRISGMFREVRIIGLDKDPKDTDIKDLQSKLISNLLNI